MQDNAGDGSYAWRGLGPYAELLNISGMEFRSYQYNIIDSIIQHGNTLVVLPTGLGKTFIGVALVARSVYEGKRALFMAPTKPLAEQHYSVISKMLKLQEGQIALLTGAMRKDARRALESSASVLVATPQTIANDLRAGSLSLSGFGVAVFDECHHAVGKYAYTYIANELAALNVLIVGLTASPGSKPERVMSLVESLNIHHIESRTSTDEDVVAYVMPKYMHTMEIELSETVKRVMSLIKPVAEESMKSLRGMGLLNFKSFESMPKGRLIKLGDEIKKISATGYRFGALFSYIKLLHAVHVYDLVATEGLYPFIAYLEALSGREHKSRAVESFISNANVREALRIAREAAGRGEEHPKVAALLGILAAYRGKSIMVFAQYRATVKMLAERLQHEGFGAMAFVGKKEGVTQQQQKQVIDDFRSGKFNVLVASSIGEEGLDIPSVDVVVFYEPIPNEIRNIQRRGRTGRFRAGDVFILVAKGTKDEVYLFVSRSRERKIASLLSSVNRKLESRYAGTAKDGQATLE
ncbi:MAG: helicase-related protein [Candidatus Micrarchaeia archaeon]